MEDLKKFTPAGLLTALWVILQWWFGTLNIGQMFWGKIFSTALLSIVACTIFWVLEKSFYRIIGVFVLLGIWALAFKPLQSQWVQENRPPLTIPPPAPHPTKVVKKKTPLVEPAPQPVTNNTVTSYNQTGGITANQVNVGPIRRHLRPQNTAPLEQYFEKFKGQKFSIDVENNVEAIALAEEIKSFFQKMGGEANIDGIATSFPPRQGVILNPDKPYIYVGVQ